MALNIVVIDDDIEIRSLTSVLLEKKGHRVEPFPSLGEASLHLESAKVELVVLDLNLGRRDALEVLQYLQRIKLTAPVLIISSCDARTASSVIKVGQASDLNMVGFLPKPLKLNDLTNWVAHLDRVNSPVSHESLNAGLANDDFFLMYQPKIDLASAMPVSVEALLRWRHPDLGIVPPDQFIRFAETNGHIAPITWKVMEMAMTQLARWQNIGVNVTMAINMSAVLFSRTDVCEITSQLLAQHRFDHSLLTLELTETAKVGNLTLGLETMTRLRIMGVGLSLDDFGTGHASFTQLYQIPFSELKVDRMFVGKIHQDPNAHAIVRNIINLGQSLGMRVVAEGIENEQQQQMLIEMGCHQGQGYFIGKPMTAEDFEDWFAQRCAALGRKAH
jgi:EAL domain-containing protein (putative c-di-GMP-specific phosphodiesterase class I)/ActR/RegA family two-component response regulator